MEGTKERTQIRKLGRRQGKKQSKNEKHNDGRKGSEGKHKRLQGSKERTQGRKEGMKDSITHETKGECMERKTPSMMEKALRKVKKEETRNKGGEEGREDKKKEYIQRLGR